MEGLLSLPGAVRDNAGLVSVPVATAPGCRGAACPAFARCGGRCGPRQFLTDEEVAAGSQPYRRESALIGQWARELSA